MNNICFTLYEDGTLDGRIDQYELLGEIAIVGYEGGIELKNVYIDDWLCSLILVPMRLIGGGDAFSIPILTESSPIEIRPSKNSVWVGYGKQETWFAGQVVFERVLLTAVEKLLAKVCQREQISIAENIAALKDFLVARR